MIFLMIALTTLEKIKKVVFETSKEKAPWKKSKKETPAQKVYNKKEEKKK